MKQLFLDCDGVLADFDQAAEIVFGFPPRQAEDRLGTQEFWRLLLETPKFYETLPVMQDAMELVDAVRHLNPIILTGCPLGIWAQEQKINWRNKNFPGIPMITTLSKDKKTHAKPGDVLVDDFLKYRHLWVDHGGIFIHHTSAATSIEALKEYFEL